jgi:integrase
MRVSFFLDKPKAELSTLFVRVGYGKQYLRYFPGLSIATKYWNDKQRQAKQTSSFPQHQEFNRRITEIRATIESIFNRYKNENASEDPEPATLKKLIDAELKPETITRKEQVTFLSYFQNFIDRSLSGTRIKKGNASAGTVYNTNKGYITTFRHIETFAAQWNKVLDFTTIDLEFYNDYTKYLTFTAKLSTNTIGDHIKRIKTVLHDATANAATLGIVVNQAFTSPYFNKTKEQTDSIYLTEIELQAIADIDLSGNKRLEQVRDLFLIGCYTGQRYSDWHKITPNQVKAGIIEITQQKTGKKIAVPMHPAVIDIFNKYNGNLPRTLSNQKMNDYIKEVAQMVPELKKIESKTITKAGQKVTTNFEKWQLVSTHTARRTFATLEYLAGTPTVTIMALTGHTTETAFLRYIKLTPNEHAKLMQLQWEKRYSKMKLKAV